MRSWELSKDYTMNQSARRDGRYGWLFGMGNEQKLHVEVNE